MDWVHHSPLCRWYVNDYCDCEELVAIIVDVPEEEDDQS